MIPTARANAEPVVITMSVLAALQFLFAGAGLGEIIGAKVVFLGMLVVGAITVGIQFWIRGQVVATANVVAQVSPAGDVVAGPASPVTDGLPVDVTPAYPVTPSGTRSDSKFFDERGAIDANSLLVAVTCLIIILVGLVWLVRAF